MSRNSIEVCIRMRPMRPELRETKEAWEVRASSIRELRNPDSHFTFDHIYNTDATTSGIYGESIRGPIVANVAKGYNATVLAYGQTGSGKSFTMLGDEGQGQPGLVYLAVADLFRLLEEEQRANSNVRRVEVSVSEIEIYNEQLRDLFVSAPAGTAAASPLASPQRQKQLSIRENEYGVYVHNATRRRVQSAAECTRLIERLTRQRISASTAMNEHSSRSHCVICIHVEKTVRLDPSGGGGSSGEDNDDGDEDDDGTSTRTGSSTQDLSHATGGAALTKRILSTLHLVDLAGSERVAKTGAVGVRMAEGGHINKSLSILTTVINRLTEESRGRGATATFVPYRDSRLTHLLKSAIGGNSFTCVLCCATPAIENVDESRSTLQFASRAKRIHNVVSINELADPKAKVRDLQIQLHRARRLLLAQTIYLWSKKVRVANLEAEVGHRSGGALLNTQIQHEKIIEGLTAENDSLRAEAKRLGAELRRATAAGGGGASPETAAASLAEEREELVKDVRDLEEMLEEAHREQQRARRAADEVDGLCRELEKANAALEAKVKGLTRKNAELEELLDAVDAEGESLRQETALLRDQLQATQRKLLDRAEGDAYLEELTKLHVAHQELQFSLGQLRERYDRDMKDAKLRTRGLTLQLHEAEDAKDESDDRCTVANAHLWRLLSACSLATTGRVAAGTDPREPVREAQVLAAVEALSRLRAQRQDAMAAPAAPAGGYTPSSRQGMLDHIRRLEERLVNKDAQRDIIVDTKLKRMQDLALKLHTMNRVLSAEVEQCCADYNAVLAAAEKHPKIASKLSKAGFYPKVAKVALDRARFAPVPSRPNGHN